MASHGVLVSPGDTQPGQLLARVLDELRALEKHDAASFRAVRRKVSAEIATMDASVVFALAEGLVEAGFEWEGWEFINSHQAAFAALTPARLKELGGGIASWGQADAFATILVGPAWREGLISDSDVDGWARSPDHWWRRIALVSTTVLNTRSRWGTGDTQRTLAVVGILIHDRDDTVVKAASWALRSLVPWDPRAVRTFLESHETELAARVKREVRTKLETGLKSRRRSVHGTDLSK
ncbi:DNA alkylation repair protein [Arthrobacter sp. AZCC_0090]|uniref:DNA alkylation repair protein n=1 Tax=Arthrobacter sp. AZCC_0090 TaxID=2735881 RepID=UPI00161EEFA9|nr:DNA alkylation repair protein [Arthrobacter sp. AZCC_0090]MBB6406056.1 3-methyladenine DNA glycosylase AlkD [Arthrobacter sp. AZCC_0090]